MALERCLELELRLGRQHALVGELTELVAAHPQRERFVEQLMRALYCSGRQADALAAYRVYRIQLREELGLDPGAALRELQSLILCDPPAVPPAPDPRIPAGTADQIDPRARVSVASDPGVPVVPRQLPAAVRHFAGRAAELAGLTALADEAADFGGPVVISAIRGTAGIGKTTLAVHWAHQAAESFPTGSCT